MKLIKTSRLLHLLLPSFLIFPSAANATLAQTPLFVNSSVPPNIFFMVDDSGSMDWEILQSTQAQILYSSYRNRDNLDITPTRDDRNEILESCVGYNVLYYDPNETYAPWVGVDINGDAYVDQSITAARNNPFKPSEGTTDLTDDEGYDDPPGYMVWNDADGDGEFDLDECPDPGRAGYDYDNQFVSTVSGFSPNQVMTAAEQQNFANWFTYYRKREYVMKAALLSVIDSSTARLGLSTLHRHDDDDFEGFPVADITSGSNRQDLSEQVARIHSENGTPLRSKLEQVGEYFEGTNDDDLFGSQEDSPILSSADGGSCQQNFAVVMSDGYWNGNTNPTVGNADSGSTADGDSNDTVFDGGTYADQNTGRSNTLADVAMHYYERDLNTSLNNEVPTSPLDGNNKQHLVTYTVAFGVDGTLSDNPAPSDTSFNWPDVTSNTNTTIDDMRHAAWNGRGEFLSASSASDLIQAFANAVASIASRTSSASSVATNSTRLESNSKIYQARFTSETWSGDLLAYNLDSLTGDVDSLAWTAADLVPAENDRNIFTYNDDNAAGLKGVVFERANLSTAHQALLSSNQVDFLRGDQSNEGLLFRSRTAVLGDIVNSDPMFAGADNFDYYNLEKDNGEATYDDYLLGTTEDWQKGNRTDMIYVGANDGMLHALLGDGDTSSGCSTGSGNCEGEEIFAYVPKAVYSNLPSLTSTSYSHQFFVDSSPVQGDAYIDFGDGEGERWGTALVGTLGAGGKGIFALDISDPLNFTTTSVLWDLDENDTDMADLGYTFSKPSIVKLKGNNNAANNSWAVVVGNGYESASGKAVLYILGLKTGEVIWKKEVETASGANGLSTPIAVDTTGNRKVDTIYAGDLLGNLWEFDVSSSDKNDWDVANYDGTTPVPLFTACTDDPCTDPQPITSKPQVVSGESGGVMVLFGTGKYFEVGDNIDVSQTQTFYGIHDDGDVVPGRDELVEQLIIDEQDTAETGFTDDVRATTNNDLNTAFNDGWYLDMFYDANTDGVHDHPGERMVSDPLVRNGRVIFATLIPETDPCSFGGSSFLMEMDGQTGSRLTISPFDNNGDGVIDENDWIHIDTDGDGVKDTWIPVSGKKSGVGIIKTPGVISMGNQELKYTSGSSGDIEVTVESSGDNLGRQSWIQIK